MPFYKFRCLNVECYYTQTDSKPLTFETQMSMKDYSVLPKDSETGNPMTKCPECFYDAIRVFEAPAVHTETGVKSR